VTMLVVRFGITYIEWVLTKTNN